MPTKLQHTPVDAISLKGKFLVKLLQAGFRVYGWFRKNNIPKRFEENPATMKWQDSVYLGYKYYYQSPEPEEESIDFFKENPFELSENTIQIKSYVSLSFGGDLMPYEFINSHACQHLWDKVGDFYFDADIVFANLETPILPSHKPSLVPEIMLNNMDFNGSEELFNVFEGMGKHKGFDVLSLANNHSLDMGEKGVAQTIEFLEKKRIHTIGTASAPNTNEDITITEVNGIKVGWLAFTFCTNHHVLPENKGFLVNTLPLNLPLEDTQPIVDRANRLRELGAEFVVGSFHMGNAYQPMPDSTIIENVRKIIDSADLDCFVGTHPHNPQPLTVIKSKSGKEVPVIFSLGDFVAWDVYTFCHVTWLVKIELGRNPEGKVQVAKLHKLLVYCQMDKDKNLRFIPIEEVKNSKEELKKTAMFPHEMEKILEYYERYLK